MADGRLNAILRHLGDSALSRDGIALTDAQLLDRFLRERDGGAFEALMHRHGPMVLGVCRRVVGNTDDAEDAFQTTFLVLVHKAATIVPRERVGPWLYGVAYHTALKARYLADRRRGREIQVDKVPEREVVERQPAPDLRPLLDQELSRLPEVYRIPVVLCDLGGKPREEVARQLSVPEGTVSSRLARGRELLRQRLVRRGLMLTGAALVPALTEAASAAVPTALLRATAQAGVLVAAGGAAALSAPVAGLLRAVLRQMALARFKVAALVLLAVGLIGLAAGLVIHRGLVEKPPDLALAAATAPAPRPGALPGPVTGVRLGDLSFPRYPHQGEWVNVNGTLFFAAGGANGPELWKCAQRPNGPRAELVKAFDQVPPEFAPQFLTNRNGTLFFVPGGGHGNELWKSDGTEAGTVIVKRFAYRKYDNDLKYLSRPVVVGKTLFFTHANAGDHGLYKTDGTEAGTVLVKRGIDATYVLGGTANVNGELFFVANDGSETGLWKSDGTAEGTVRLRGADPARPFESPSNLTDVNGTLFFVAMGPIRGRRMWRDEKGFPLVEVPIRCYGLWKSDGTAAGTVMVKEINPNFNPHLPTVLGNVTAVGRTLFFVADDGVHGRKLWKSDGTAAGTIMVKDVSPGPAWQFQGRRTLWGLMPERPMTGVNGVLFFLSDDGRLWKSDGAAAGTVPVKRIAPNLVKDNTPGLVSLSCVTLTNINGLLYCAVDDGPGEFKLWRTDGTEAGTVLINERKYALWARPVAMRLTALIAVDKAMFFTTAQLTGPPPGRWSMELWQVPAPR
jgi:RNA polymerase sigma factor (sigma-70 family)